MDLNLSKYRWVYPENDLEYRNNLLALEKAGLGYSPAFLRILANRGAQSVEDVEALIDPEPQLYHDPFLLYDMERAKDRIQAAIMTDEKILIYGDYDADGISSTLILFEALEILGANVIYYLPHRFHDGYGPNLTRYQEFIDQGIQLIITCDNGVAGHDAVSYAQSQDVDVIITDHHEIKATLPDAFAVIHPRHPLGHYPFGDLSGAGVALKLACVLLEDIPPEALELAMIGTIADLVPLVDENRTIVMSGLSIIKHTQRPGLHALFEKNAINMSEINEETIGFVLAPRLNAVGRLGDPNPGFRLLASFDESEIFEMLEIVEAQNRSRKQISQEITESLVARLNSLSEIPDIIIEASKDWHPGVLGIVAGNISEKYHRPTILFNYMAEEGKYKGSGRSISGVDLFHLVDAQGHLLTSFGGHAQAIGLTISEENWQRFTTAITNEIKAYKSILSAKPQIVVDTFIDISEANRELSREIDLLRPFGFDNQAPLVGLKNLAVDEKKVIGPDQQTLKLSLSSNQDKGQHLQAIGFKMGNRIHDLNDIDTNSIIGKLTINRWNQQEIPQLQIYDFGSQGSVWQDLRSSTIPEEILNISSALYLFQNAKILEEYHQLIPKTSQASLYRSPLEPSVMNFQELVIFELPTRMEEIARIIRAKEWEKITLGAFSQESKVIAGLPTRKEAAEFYRWLASQPPFEVRSNLQEISKLLNFPIPKIIVLIMMFFDAGFVNIKDGWLQFRQEDKLEKVDLFMTPSYLKYSEAMKIEELLVYQPMAKVKEFFEGN